MEQNVALVTGQPKKPLSAYVVSRTFVLPESMFSNIVAVKGYGATENKLVAKVAGIELNPGEVSYLASPIYASGLSALALDNQDFDDNKIVGILITVFKPRV